MMRRTTIHLPENLYYRLQMAAKHRQQSLSHIIAQVLDKALVKGEDAHLQQVYQAMEKVKGVCKDPIRDASTTIDEVLYGENGAWRGRG